MRQKVIAIILIISSILITFSSCKTEEIKENQLSGGDAINRFHLFSTDNKLHCLDAKDGTTVTIESDVIVTNVSNAIFSEATGRMLIEVVTAEHDTALLLWNGGEKADLVDTGASLVRVNEAMNCITYTKNNIEELYQYKTTDKVKKICDYPQYVSVNERSGSMLIVSAPTGTMILPENFNYTSAVEQLKSSMWDLWYKDSSGSETYISRIYSDRLSAATDHSAVCYLKDAAEELTTARQAYLWTPETGEQELPFKATTMLVNSKTEIYYFDGSDLYMYNGKESTRIYQDVNTHGHKLSEQIFCWHRKNDEGDLLLYKGTVLEIPSRLCSGRNEFGGISQDGNTVYYWNDDTWYKATVKSDGTWSTSTWIQGPAFTSKNTKFIAEQLVHSNDGVLYCNGQTVASDVSNWNLEDNGVLYYTNNSALYSYQNGNNTKITDVNQLSSGIVYENNVIIKEDSGIYILIGSDRKLVVGSSDTFISVKTWDVPCLGTITHSDNKTGWWFELTASDKITKY